MGKWISPACANPATQHSRQQCESWMCRRALSNSCSGACLHLTQAWPPLKKAFVHWSWKNRRHVAGLQRCGAGGVIRAVTVTDLSLRAEKQVREIVAKHLHICVLQKPNTTHLYELEKARSGKGSQSPGNKVPPLPWEPFPRSRPRPAPLPGKWQLREQKLHAGALCCVVSSAAGDATRAFEVQQFQPAKMGC